MPKIWTSGRFRNPFWIIQNNKLLDVSSMSKLMEQPELETDVTLGQSLFKFILEIFKEAAREWRQIEVQAALWAYKVGCVSPMVIFSIVLCVEFRPIDYL